jgi:membrane protease YdiL (CAAX protease family)
MQEPRMNDAARSLFSLRWRPGWDTAFALLTGLLMIPVYYVGAHDHSGVAGLLVFVIFGNGILNVLLPAYYVLVVRREGPEELGITTRRLWLAVLLSLACCLFSWKGLQREAASNPDVDLLRLLVFNSVILWEPLFVYGWLELRFERAFGILPGIVLAAICFGAYHLGTFPLPGVVGLVVVGVVFGVVFRITRNLLTLWPATWAVVSSIGTMQGKMQFGWDQVALYAVILLVQIVAIAWMVRNGRKRACGGRDGESQKRAV